MLNCNTFHIYKTSWFYLPSSPSTSFIAFLLEQNSKVFSIRVVWKFLSSHYFLKPVQSDFNAHFKQTVIFKVSSDVLECQSNDQFSALSLLDLSVAFDILDHSPHEIVSSLDFQGNTFPRIFY